MVNHRVPFRSSQPDDNGTTRLDAPLVGGIVWGSWPLLMGVRTHGTSSSPAGGFAALEVVLALRARTGGATRISLVAPDPPFAYRPAATLEAFSDAAPRAFDLGARDNRPFVA